MCQKKNDHNRLKYGLQHGILAQTAQQALKDPKIIIVKQSNYIHLKKLQILI